MNFTIPQILERISAQHHLRRVDLAEIMGISTIHVLLNYDEESRRYRARYYKTSLTGDALKVV